MEAGLELFSCLPSVGIIAVLQTTIHILFPISSTKVVLGGIIAEKETCKFSIQGLK